VGRAKRKDSQGSRLELVTDVDEPLGRLRRGPRSGAP